MVVQISPDAPGNLKEFKSSWIKLQIFDFVVKMKASICISSVLDGEANNTVGKLYF